MPSARSSYRDFDNSDPYNLDTPASIVRDPARSARSSLPLSAISGAEQEKTRTSRFMENVPTRQSAEVPSGKTVAASSSPTVIDPASIPTRTSSSRATTNGGDKATSPKSPTTPRKSKGFSLFPSEPKRKPEVSENDWITASKASKSSPESTRRESNGNLLAQSQPGMESAQPVGQDLIHGDGFSWSAEKENIVKGPFDYLESHPGKDIRTQLINAFNLWLQVPEPSLAIINRVIGMLHSASLLIDDVEDNSNLRRGVPVAHSIFGVAQTINSANYVYFLALQELTKLNNPEAIQIYTDELLSLHRGQGMDLFWRDTLTCPSEDDYLEMVGNKTGGLFRLAIKLMCAESPSHHFQSSRPGSSDTRPEIRQQADYVPLVNTIGLLFQILDDYRNLSDTTYTANKGLCEDLTEGKFSFPIIHAIRANPANLVLINILKQKPTDDDVKRYAVAYMEKTGSFSYTRRVLRGLTKKALALVDEVDAGRGMGGGIGMILEKLKVDKGKDAKDAKAAAAA